MRNEELGLRSVYTLMLPFVVLSSILLLLS